jgi:hypothetical protein
MHAGARLLDAFRTFRYPAGPSQPDLKREPALTSMRTVLAICALALPIPAAVAGCGGGDDKGEDPQQVLDETFNNDTKVSSGVIDITANVSAGDQGSFDFELKGPFQGDANDPTALPQLDWTATASGQGAGQSIDFSGQLVVTDDNAYIVYNGTTYEVGTDTFNQFKSQFEKAAGQAGASQSSTQSFSDNCKAAVAQAGGDTSACDIDFASWLTNLSNDGTSDIEGTSTTHISGDANISQIVSDLLDIAKATGGAGAASQIPQAQLDQVEQAISDAHIDVYSGEDDHVIRKLDLSLSADPSAIGGVAAAAVGSVDVDFAVTLSGVNEDQSVSAPAGPTQPLSDLFQGLGGAGLPFGSLGSGSGSGSGLGGSSSSGGSASSQKYLDCISKATSTADQQKCLALL